MKKYRNKNFLRLIIIVAFFLLGIFLYFLKEIKLWTFESYTIMKINDLEYNVFINSRDLKLFRENNFFYFDSVKYCYKIIDSSIYNENIILSLKVFENLTDHNKMIEIALPKLKKSLFSLIIDSWRSK